MGPKLIRISRLGRKLSELRILDANVQYNIQQ